VTFEKLFERHLPELLAHVQQLRVRHSRETRDAPHRKATPARMTFVEGCMAERMRIAKSISRLVAVSLEEMDPLFSWWLRWVDEAWFASLPRLTALRCMDLLMTEGRVAFVRTALAMMHHTRRQLRAATTLQADMIALDDSCSAVHDVHRFVSRARFSMCAVTSRVPNTTVNSREAIER
jgi:hypothetical protein